MSRLLPASLAIAVLLSACTSDPPADEPTTLFPSESQASTEDESAAPSADPSPSATASADETPTEIDVTTTPDVITLEWAEAVVNTLLAEYGEIASEVLALPVVASPDQLPPDVFDRTRALFDGEYEERRIDGLNDLGTDAGFIRSEVLPASEYGFIRMRGTLLQFANESCVVLVGPADFSVTIPDGGVSDILSAWSLSRTGSGSDANPTEWVLIDELSNIGPDSEALPDELMLNASVEDYGENLDTTCDEEAAA